MTPTIVNTLAYFQRQVLSQAFGHRDSCNCNLCLLHRYLDAAGHYASVAQRGGARCYGVRRWDDREWVTDRNLTLQEAQESCEWLNDNFPPAEAAVVKLHGGFADVERQSNPAGARPWAERALAADASR